jgi:hypothetical protein
MPSDHKDTDVCLQVLMFSPENFRLFIWYIGKHLERYDDNNKGSTNNS